jgi:hypothetical protein
MTMDTVALQREREIEIARARAKDHDRLARQKKKTLLAGCLTLLVLRRSKGIPILGKL